MCFKHLTLQSILTLTAYLAVASSASAVAQPQNDGSGPRLPITIGNITVVQGNLTHRNGVVLDDKGTVYLLSIFANGETKLLRISRWNAVKQLVIYRGWPYVLDKRNRLWAFDITWRTAFVNKLPYMSMRTLRMAPLAFGTGLGLYGLTLLDQTFTGVMLLKHLTPGSAFIGGIVGFYGLDAGNTLLLKTPGAIGWGGNYFKELVDSGVSELRADAKYDDWLVVSKKTRASGTQYRNLSVLAPTYAGLSSCLEYLTKMNLR